MNGILLLAHAPLAHALRQGALHVFAEAATAVAALDVQPNEQPELTLAQATVLAEQLGCAHVLALADVFGATPCNVGVQFVQQWNARGAGHAARLVAGVNLPMLLRALNYRHEPLDQLVSRALAGGTQGVLSVSFAVVQQQVRPHHDPSHHDHQQ